MYNMDLTLRTDSSLPTFPSRKEARTASLSLSQGAREYVARKVEGVWAVVPREYVEATEEAGDTLPDTLDTLEEAVREYVAVEVEAVEEVAQEEAQEAQEAQEAPSQEVVEEAPTEEDREARKVALRTELEALRARVRELEGELASLQVHVLVTSTVARPVALLRDIFLANVTPEGNPGSRKEVVALAVKAGMAPNTAKTQYQVLSRALRTPTDPKHSGLWEDLEALRSNMEEVVED